MLGNGLANIIAAAIIAGAILWSGSAERSRPAAPTDEKAYADWYARAVGDIRNDIVVNCGCCGDEDARERRADNGSF